MRLGEPAIAQLIRAKHDAGRDLFLVPDVPFSFTDASALSATLRENLLVFLPGDYYPAGVPDGACFFYEKGENLPRFTFPPAPFICYADIRLAGNEAFQAAMLAAEIYEWILPFADCADPAEHGYRKSYAYLAEIRASSGRFIGITALFDDPPDEERYQKRFGDNDYLSVRFPSFRRVDAIPAGTETGRLQVLLRACAMQPDRSTAVIFPTRRHADEFTRLLLSQCPCAALHGGFFHEQNAENLRRFRAGEFRVLAATKHILPSAPFLEVQRVFFAGLPFSAALLGRCAALLPPEKTPVCVTADTDPDFNRRLAASCAEALDLPKTAFEARRQQKLDRVLELLRP